MSYISLYRKWRSQNFDEIIGQEAVVTTLKNAIKLDRLAHAYLFSGPRGTGKTSVARILAKALNCKEGPTPNPCGKCDLCTKIRGGHSVDVIEIDAASNRGIDEIRDLRERVRFTPVEGKYKIYIIDEVHMLTSEAFNALLKTLEEPPKHVVFILATTDPQRVPVTIWSRCQRLDFRKIPLAKIIEQLKMIAKSEKIEIEERALFMIGRSAGGSMRDAISLLDQLISFAGNKVKVDDVVMVLGGAEEEVLFGFAEALCQGDVKKTMSVLEKNVEEGKSVLQITKDLISHFRYLLFAKLGINELIDLSLEQQKEIQDQAMSFSEEELKTIIRFLSRAHLDMKWQPQARIVLETALLEIMVEARGDKAQEGPRSDRGHTIEKAEKVKEQVAEGQKEESERKPLAAMVQAASGNGFMEKLTRNWESILEKVKGKTLFGYVSLHEGRPVGINDKGKLIIEYKKGFSFHKQRLEDKLNKDAVEEAIAEITGQKMQIEGMVADRVEDGSPVSKVQDSESFSLEKVKEIFGGKVL